ncbi:MAG: phosphopantothenoylcysteine decarboxylase [Gemmataceae bacterium]
MKVLVTAGNTQSPLDRVRCITNIFSGRTGLRSRPLRGSAATPSRSPLRTPNGSSSSASTRTTRPNDSHC